MNVELNAWINEQKLLNETRNSVFSLDNYYNY